MARTLDTPGTIRLGPGFLDDLPMPSDRLVIADKYTVLETIARGGMGVVYKAWQENLNRVVAVKMLLGGVHASEEFRQRFLQEAKAAARLRHPNIVSIHDWGEDSGQPFFSMDFIDGDTLAKLARDHPLSPRLAAEIVQTIAQAINYAHAEGVLHRDLKPSNVLMDAAGLPRVTDFGLARQINEETMLTVSGDFLGTPGYLPPEQVSAKRERIGPQSDIYGLGAILYYLVTSQPPYLAKSPAEALRALEKSDPIPPRRINASVPLDLETICLKCLAREPQRRYTSAQDLADDLDRFLRNQPIAARPVGSIERTLKWFRREPTVAGLATTVFVFAVALGTVIWHWRTNPQRENAAAIGSSFLVSTGQPATNVLAASIPSGMNSPTSTARPTRPEQLAVNQSELPESQPVPTNAMVDSLRSETARPIPQTVQALEQASAKQPAALQSAQVAKKRLPMIVVAKTESMGLPRWDPAMGETISRLLSTELSRLTNFQILDTHALDELREVVAPSEKGKWKSADFMLKAVVTRFGRQQENGVGSVGLNRANLEGRRENYGKSPQEIEVNWRVIDTSTREVVSSGRAFAFQTFPEFELDADGDFFASALGRATTNAIGQIVEKLKAVTLAPSRVAPVPE